MVEPFDEGHDRTLQRNVLKRDLVQTICDSPEANFQITGLSFHVTQQRSRQLL
jgi:hypothetical protein